jgi:hypothetical protein
MARGVPPLYHLARVVPPTLMPSGIMRITFFTAGALAALARGTETLTNRSKTITRIAGILFTVLVIATPPGKIFLALS